MKKLPRGIIKIRVCSKCPDRVPVEVTRGKRKLTVCVLDPNCPDKKKYGPDYYIRYKVDGKDIKEKVGPSLLMAKKALSSRKGEVAQGKFKLEEIRPGITIKDFAENNYLEYAKQNKRSWDRDRRSIIHIIEHLGDYSLKQLSTWHVESYKVKRSKEPNRITKTPVAPATINRELSCLKYMFNLAMKWGYAEKNPVRGVKFFEEYGKERYLTENEIGQILTACSEKLHLIVLMAILTGMRLSEILGLQWEDVDLENGLITVIGERSKNKSVRHIPITSLLTNELRSLKIIDNSFVFPSPHGGSLKSVRSTFNRAVKKAGLKDVTFHTLRHIFASHHVMEGTDLFTLKKLGGWKSLKMVQRYSHLSQEHERRAAERLEKVVKVENKWKTEAESKKTTSQLIDG